MDCQGLLNIKWEKLRQTAMTLYSKGKKRKWTNGMFDATPLPAIKIPFPNYPEVVLQAHLSRALDCH